MQLEQTVDDRMREFLNYSQRCAYKALKRLTLKKNLNFKPEVWEEMSVRSRASTDRSILDTDKSDVAESESPESGTRSPEFPFFREIQGRLRETWAANIGKQDAKYKLLKSDSGKSFIAPAKSLAKSAFSTKFAKYETQQNRSANLLDAIPRVSCFRRRNRDRCLSCMYKSLRKTSETEASLSRATLLTEIEAKDDSESSSSGLSELREELRKIYSQRKEILRYPEMVEDTSSKSTSPSLQVEQEDTEISIKIDPNQSKDKTLKSTESLLSKDPKSLKAISSSISISSDIERSKISSSEAHTSDDETSSPLALDNDPSQYKNMAPCHLPTVLLPSMEPLRVLRHRKPTTLESRIALMESATSTKEKSDDEYYDDEVKTAEITKERPPSKRTGEKPEKIDEKKDAPSKTPRALLKVKSQQQLISPIVESARKGELRRGYSCASIKDLSKDSTRCTFKTPRGEAEDERGKVIPLEEIDSAKGSTSSDSVKAERRVELPLSTVAEISRFLEKANRGDMSTALVSLANEFCSRVIKHDTGTTAAKKRAKLAARLTKLLVESKRYLNPDKFPSDLVFSAKQPPACNTRLLRRILPLDSYNLVAPLLGMSTWYPKRAVRKVKAEVHYETEEEEKEEEEEEETEGAIPFDLIVRKFYSYRLFDNKFSNKCRFVENSPLDFWHCIFL